MRNCNRRNRNDGSGNAFYASSVGSSKDFIDRVITLGDFYRGGISFNEIKNLPAGEFKMYWNAALERQASQARREQQQMEILEDEMS